MLDGLLHPHSSIPYVQIGRSIVLYTVSLLSRDSCERVFISQLMYVALWGKGEMRVGFWWGELREKDHLKDIGVGVKIILKNWH